MRKEAYFAKSIISYVLFCSILIVPMFFSGCGTSSEDAEKKTLSVQASEQTLETIAEETTQPLEENSRSAWAETCPEIYQDIWTEGNVTYIFDAKVIPPEQELFKQYQLQRQSLSQETVDRAVDYFFGNREQSTLSITYDYMSLLNNMKTLGGTENHLHWMKSWIFRK